MTVFADEVYAALEPLATADSTNGFALRALVRAIGSMFAQPEEAIRDLGDGKRSWERIWNPDRAPLWLLPFIGQSVGVQVDTSLSKAVQIEQIKEEGQWHRGTPASIVKAVQSTLYSAVNMITTPSVEYVLGAWKASPINFGAAGATISKVTSQAFSGTSSLQVVTTAAPTNQGVEIPIAGTFLKGVTYNFSIYLKGNAGGEVGQIGLGNAAQTGLKAFTLTTSWQRIEVNFTPTVDRTGVTALIQHTAASAITLFADAAMCVAAAKVAPAYADGDTAGWKWFGAPGESISVNTSTAGAKRVRLIERNSTAWTLLIVTYPSETPDPVATKNAAYMATPGGIIVTVELSELPLIDEATREIALMTEGTIDNATLAQVT